MRRRFGSDQGQTAAKQDDPATQTAVRNTSPVITLNSWGWTTHLSDWIVSFVGRMGGLGVALLMLLENIFPPIPSELIMPLAGYHAQTGQGNLALMIAAGWAGSLAGTALWYFLGRKVGEHRLRQWVERHGRWLTLSGSDIDKSKEWFHRRGAAAVFFCRMIPAVRSVISLPAGFSGMPVAKFFVLSAAGTLVWTAALGYAGYVLGQQYEAVEKYLGPVSTALLAFSAAAYLWRVIRHKAKPATP